MPFDIKDTTIKVGTAEVDSVGGAKPEPEERPVMITQRAVQFEAPMRQGSIPMKQIAPREVNITEVTTVEQALKRPFMCLMCRHFSKEKGQQLLRHWATLPHDSPEGSYLLMLRAYLMGQREGVPTMLAIKEVDQHIAEMGLCEAYSQVLTEKEKTVCCEFQHPHATCPDDETLATLGPDNTPVGVLFEPADRDMAKGAQSYRDDLLLIADRKVRP